MIGPKESSKCHLNLLVTNTYFGFVVFNEFSGTSIHIRDNVFSIVEAYPLPSLKSL